MRAAGSASVPRYHAQLVTADGRLHIGVAVKWRMLQVSRRSSSSGIPRYWKHKVGPPRSRASKAMPAAMPPPALPPITPIRSGSMPSSAALAWAHTSAA